jgi:hypothetical protein
MIGELTNHFWQSTLFAVVAGLPTVAFRKNRAQLVAAQRITQGLRPVLFADESRQSSGVGCASKVQMYNDRGG